MKRTKTKLVSSIVTLLVCFAMLVGSTFAWFTDSASTGVNKIQAGNLNLVVEHKNAKVTAYETIESKTNLFKDANGDAMKWEPGAMSWETFKVSNAGDLAFKYVLQTNITGFNTVTPTGKSLKDVLKVKVLTGDEILDSPSRESVTNLGWNGSEPTLESFVKGDGKLYPDRTDGRISTEEFQVVVYWMPTDNDNEWNVNNDKTTIDDQPLFIDFGIKVLATQLEHEFDSFDNTYDKDATYLMYPSGVTAQSFETATSVEYTNNLGETVTGDKPAVAAYVDSEGNVKYVGDISAAVNSGATEIYCKQNTTLRMRERLEDTNRSPDLTNNLTIYANGADFQYGEISMNMTSAGKASSITLKVYDAKNIKVWGATPNDGVTQTIVMENCTNIGQGRTQDNGIMMYITGNTGTVNATVKDCYVTANSSGIYMSTNGSLTVSGSTFVDCATGIKTSYKGAGTRTDRIENCVFTNCGCTADMAGDTAWLKDDSAAYKYKNSSTGTISLTTKGNTITGTIGDKGDIQIVGNVNLTGDTANVSNQQQANDAITNATADNKVNIVIAPNETINLDNGIANNGENSRDITFIGNGSQTVDVITNAVSAEGGMLNYQRGSSFTFENLTIKAGEGTYDGIVCDELTYINCTITGKLTLFGKATFINCTFENTMANQYSIWTWGGTDVKFEDCTFNTNGKAILLFGEEKTTNLTVNNCTFNDRNNGTAGKAAIEIGDANYGKHNNFTVVINGSTVASGFDAGQNTGSKLWANKNSMDAAHLTVTIDGSQIQ